MASLPSPSSSSTRQWKYDVFLSFRGEDTRRNFTDHLYVALQRKGIITFRDEEELEKGKSISELFKTIEESQFAIIILSKNYASSTWCLDELTKIIKCKEEIKMIVLPLFYDVDPTDVRKQIGTFEQAFNDHQKHFKDNIEKVEAWRATLRKVADISGWHLQNRGEAEFIEHIVEQMMKKLSSKFSRVTKNFIGIESMVAELIPSYLGFENNVYMIGICGMGGLGKTTLASVIYDKYFDYFEGSSFITNIRERSEKGDFHELQQQLLDEIFEGSTKKNWNFHRGVNTIKSRLCHKKVLLVLDDVNHVDQLEKLAGEHDWFGSGSWIIVTTRDEHVLVQHEVLKIYKPNGLNNDDASKLFCLKAFKNEQPKEGYMHLSQEVVKYANGLPLVLVTLGSFLVGRKIDEWQSALENFKKNPKREIFGILKISYDGLDEMWKEIFLDIACFFIRWRKNQVIHILENCGFDARIGISVLVEKSLLTIDDNECLGMHDLLQEMGEKIVRFELGGKLGKQSRLWLIEDLFDALANNMAAKSIQAIVLHFKNKDFNFKEFSEVFWYKDFISKEFAEVFSTMSNLRLLIIDGKDILNAISHDPNDQRHFAVPNELRHLSWTCCPLKYFPYSFQSKELVQLELPYNKFEYLWEGVTRFAKLKFIDLSYSFYLVRTPDFSGVPRLERLNISFCHRLVEIHSSIGQLSRLRYLHLRHCKCVTDLPSMSTEMLVVLDLFGCLKISSIPKFTGIMKSLSELYLGKTAIKKLAPSSIECLTALTFLDLTYCKNLECLPSNMDNLSALTLLDLTNCENLECLPSNMENLRSLEKLILYGCSRLESLPRLPSTVRFINAQCCSSLKPSPALAKLSSLSTPMSYDSGVAFTILFHYLQALLCRKTIYEISTKRKEDGSIIEFQIIVSGYKIPLWLTHRRMGNSISIELPSNWCSSKWMGFAFCATISTCEEVEFDVRAHVVALGDMPQKHHAFELFTSWMHCKDSIWLLYLSRDNWFAIVGNGECSQINVIFETYDSTYCVWECGVSLVYEQDVEKFTKQMHNV